MFCFTLIMYKVLVYCTKVETMFYNLYTRKVYYKFLKNKRAKLTKLYRSF